MRAAAMRHRVVVVPGLDKLAKRNCFKSPMMRQPQCSSAIGLWRFIFLWIYRPQYDILGLSY